MKPRYVFGIDFGTESARAVLTDVNTGDIAAVSSAAYRHGVIAERLPDSSVSLEEGWALQHPLDYLDSMRQAIRSCMVQSGIDRHQVIGLGIAFTSCTILPIDKTGNPLCLDPRFRDRPHSWVKLWKHHAAQKEANRINRIAEMRQEPFMRAYGMGINAEWLLPKVWQVLNEDPEIYQQAAAFIEAGDWVVLQLTGLQRRNSCAAGYKGMWSKRDGYPAPQFLAALDPRLENFANEKLSGAIYPIGTKAGPLSGRMAEVLGLCEGIAVGVAAIDAHAAVLGAGITEPGKMLIVMGTSFCHMCLSEEEITIPGVAGVVEDGIIPGFFGYEAGQAAGGDTLAWLVHHAVPDRYHREAEARGISVYDLLEEKAARLAPGESGLLALDWFNGNRSVLNDSELTGMIVGLTLHTTAEEIFRALMEALAFGTRVILDAFASGGIHVDDIHASGGLAVKNKLFMQMLADISGKRVHIVESAYASALGAAVLGAVAAGAEAGGYDSIREATRQLVKNGSAVFRPNPACKQIYDSLFQLYLKLHDEFGRKPQSIMKQLKEIKTIAKK